MGNDWGTNDDGGWGDSATDTGGWGDSGDTNNNESSDKGEKKRGCFKCGEEGHNKADCPQAGEGGGEKKGCFKCGGDHMAKDCEQPDKCRKCGEEGHMSKDCETGPKTHTVQNEDGTTREIYVPTETTDDDLFKSGITSGINFDRFDKIPVKLSGENAPKGVLSFEEMQLRPILLDNIKKSGYQKPTPIQKTAIPCIMAKRDLMGCAQTGSGKTAAFLLPIIHKILEDGGDPHAGDCPQKPEAVIVAPTRELAIQIKDEARKFSAGTNVRAVVAYGGTSVGFQLSNVFKGCNILIATPGRLLDFVDKEKISFDNLQYLVLDEADRMLDMGFLPDITRVMTHSSMPKKGDRRTLMFSATFPDQVQHMAIDFLEQYLFLTIGIVGGASSDVTQTILEVEKFGKRNKLIELLRDVGTDKTLIFVETKRNADFLATALSQEGFPTTSIHGDRLQREREEALRDFKSGKMPILVATAVAARGLDIQGVAHVINYDMPKEIDEYVHRIGRTGRVGNLGKATSFFDAANDGNVANDLLKILGEAGQEVPEFLSNGGIGSYASGGGGTYGGQDIRKGQEAVTNDDDGW